MDKTKRILLDNFIDNMDNNSLKEAIKQVIIHIEVDKLYDTENIINNFIDVLRGAPITQVSDITQEHINNMINSRFATSNSLDKKSIIIEKVDNVYKQVLISYKDLNNSYRYKTTVSFDDLFCSVKES